MVKGEGGVLPKSLIWHCGQFDTADNLAPGKFGTLGKSGQFGTTDNLAPRTIWQHSAKVDNLAPKIRLMLKMQFPAARNPK